MNTCLAFLAALLLSLPASAQPVKKNGHLSVQGTQLLNARGLPVVLRGVSFGWANWHPRYYNEEAVRWLAADWHCSVVRAAMGIEPEGAYKTDSAAAIARVESVICGAIDAGIYVIVDWHSHNINRTEAKAFFSRMAKKWGRYPNVIWEIFNEPDHESWAEVKSYAEEIIAAIRQYDPDNLILVGSPHWDTDQQLVAKNPIRGASNIMYTMHFYANEHRGWLRERCDSALRAGIPIFISECASMQATGDGPIDRAEWNRFIQWAETRRISWLVWSVSDKNETCSMLQKGAAAAGGWKPGELKETGVMTRDLLRRLNRLP